MTQQPDRRHILFVDDDAASRRIVERVLRAGVPDVRLTCVSDGVKALEALERERVDLLITDLSMPEMDGIELLRQVSNRRIAIPVIVVTGHGSPADETRALAGGALEYFEKPLDAAALVRCVQELLAAAEHRSRIEGLSIAGFVQLLSMERKTCALRASVPGAQGVLFFHAGTLVDARQAELSGADAALEIFTWKEPLITLEAQARGRPVTIHVGVTELLLESARLADERERNMRRKNVQGGASARTEPASVAAGGSKGPALSLVPSRRPMPRPLQVPPSQPAELVPDFPQAAWEHPEVQVTIARLLAEAMKLDGAIGAAVAHWELNHTLGALGEGSPPRADLAVTGNCRVMRALMTSMLRLGLRGQVQDILITLDEQSHILWPISQYDGLFLYMAIDRARGNLALTRLRLQRLLDIHRL